MRKKIADRLEPTWSVTQFPTRRPRWIAALVTHAQIISAYREQLQQLRTTRALCHHPLLISSLANAICDAIPLQRESAAGRCNGTTANA